MGSRAFSLRCIPGPRAFSPKSCYWFRPWQGSDSGCGVVSYPRVGKSGITQNLQDSRMFIAKSGKMMHNSCRKRQECWKIHLVFFGVIFNLLRLSNHSSRCIDEMGLLPSSIRLFRCHTFFLVLKSLIYLDIFHSNSISFYHILAIS